MLHDILSAKAEEVLGGEGEVSGMEIVWERPKDRTHGDFATSFALQCAKKVQKNPKDIATVLKEGMETHEDIEKVDIAGPGYVNVWMTPDALIRGLSQTRESCTAKVKQRGSPIIVEYSQPNIAKPLGAHHLLTTLIGQSVANLYEHLGFDVITWNYMGDWGTQFGKLAVAVEKWGDGRPAEEYSVDELLELYVHFHNEVDNDPTLEDQGREKFRLLEQGDKELRIFWEAIVSTTKESLSGTYKRMNVSFDTDKSESFYEDKMEPILQEGIDKNVFIEGKEGALIVEFDETSSLPPYLVRKGDGATLYSTRDLAQMRYRIDECKPEKILIVTDIAQKLHFEQLEQTCEKLAWDMPYFENVLVGRMRYADKSMSTRKGNVLKLEEVLEEAVKRADDVIKGHGESIQTDSPDDLKEMMGIGAVAYGILSQNRRMDIVFDWDTMLSFDGNSAPYLQYTHARAKSVLRKAELASIDMPKNTEMLTDLERVLIGTLLQFSLVLEDACVSHMPHKLARYLYALCQDYNAFYNTESILKADEKTKTLRLALTACTADVLKAGAELLTIHVPDRM
jgi:arginyl-tRNA synthetase